MAGNISVKLLLVEDEAVIALNEKISLESYGYEVVPVSEAGEAVRIAGEMEIDLILMDIDLGPSGPDGIETAELILKGSDIPVIFLSSHSEPECVERTEKIPSYGFIEKGTSFSVMDAMIKTALRLSGHTGQSASCHDSEDYRRTEDRLERAQLILHDVLDTIPVRVFWKDLNSVYMGCNLLFALDSGRNSPEEIIGLTDYDIRIPDYAKSNRMDDEDIKKRGEPKIHYEEPFLNQNGEQNWIVTSKFPLRNNEGKIYGILGMYSDITESKRLEKELVLQKNRLTNILHGSNVGTWEWHVQDGVNIVNDHWASIIGYTLEELPVSRRNSWKEFLHPEDLGPVNMLLDRHFKNEHDYFECEFRMRHKDGHWVWVLSRGKVVAWTEDKKPALVSGTHLDINERKKAKEEILRQLSEKEVILKEAHHRIKNNIASISSLLSLQAEAVASEEAREALLDAMGRVHSMQMLYEKLLIADDCRKTPLRHYLDELVDDIVDVFPERSNITVEKYICDYELDARQVFPLGIIVNELITNVMKYAFTGRDSGFVRISLEENNGELTLEVTDNGNGLPEEFDMNSQQEGFGIMLIKILCEQLAGEFRVESKNGTRSVLKFRAFHPGAASSTLR